MYKKKLNDLLSKINEEEGAKDWRELEKNIMKFVFIYYELSDEQKYKYEQSLDTMGRAKWQLVRMATSDLIQQVKNIMID